ncbi:non-canonical purine NTP pyrophosphatase, RdgB/HAM1 family [Paenibacillus sp. BIHB 4019]|uniref:dITP/XTP pyrophosphatase n=1 Tax=Paenibacillus sp. BIHB 4019 TaxID=1870819 RepID=A0A1B2DTS0_9BACL|nr:RdgB/HAM1 family non-canonical purine NTP pyrophosphatase [Paenibacillus sp. BIHB 4019]ANY71106.1 non-canonical purine NTP pyrophosphatase, RdgB/HAM1 family [Paenibacillus sp. BIHB 4019]
MELSSEIILIATKNEGKVQEFAHAFAKLGKRVVSLNEYPEFADIVEDGDTFSANARIKAKAAGDAFQVPVLADDSGLSVAALAGAPGVYSARYSGEGATDSSNNAKLLAELNRLALPEAAEALEDGTKLLSRAQFVCVLALYDPATGEFMEAEGTVDGFIMDKPRGDGGFGYDPLFWLPTLNRGMAQLSKEEKQQISHRGNALKELLPKLV